MNVKRPVLALLLAAAGAVMAQEPVVFESHGTRQALDGYFLKCEAQDCNAALVVTPTCAGIRTETGALHPGYAGLAANISKWANVLVIDHFSTRGRREDCPKTAVQRITSENDRGSDVLGAYEWLAKRPGIDPARIALMSFGGASPILAVQKSSLAKLGGLPGFAAVVAFYPVCNELPLRAYDAYTPLLILHGEADNWNTIRSCRDLAQRQAMQVDTGKVDLVAYPGAHHAFNFNTPTQNWPGTRFTTGGDSVARMDAFARSREFLGAAFAARAAGKN